MSTLVDEVFDQLSNLHELCDSFFECKRFTAYKGISVILRSILRGSSGDDPLLKQVLPDARLSRLKVTNFENVPEDHLVLPADTTICSGGTIRLPGGVRVQTLMVHGGAVKHMEMGTVFSSEGLALSLDDWITQSFLRPEWTLSDFIGTVAHKDGGAHFDPNNAKLIAMERWGSFHWHVTARLDQGVHEQILEQLNTVHSGYERHLP